MKTPSTQRKVRNAFVSDTVRGWLHAWRPFLSIVIISMLGVAVLTGIYAGCRDAFLAADRFYEQQGLHDVQVLSSVGFSDDDVQTLRNIQGVDTVQPEHAYDVSLNVDGKNKIASIINIGSKGIDQPYVQEGKLPTQHNEIAVTKQFIHDTGEHIGSVIHVTPQLDPTHAQDLTITGVVLNPEDLNNPDGFSQGAFRNTATSDYTIYAPKTTDTTGAPRYSAVSLSVSDARKYDTFSDDYDDAIRAVAHRIEDASPQGAQWFVQPRSALSSFSSFKSDVTSIEKIGKAFPIVFLIVAVMMSLTTISRLVEEDRSLHGTLLGLGYSGSAIVLRYVIFAALACLIGSGLGLLIGFLGIPAFLLVVIQGLYVLPDVQLEYDWLYGSLGTLLFVVCVVGAALVATIREVRQTPAALMRPKAPKAGARIVLEHIRPIWNRMSFLNKVTARNIFRFKSRLIMTVGGVAGCTALIVCGLAINDTVHVLGKHQFEQINQYDMLVVANHGQEQALQEMLADDGRISDAMWLRIEQGELVNADDHGESVQLNIVPNDEIRALNDMIALEPARDDNIFGWVGHLGSSRTAHNELTLSDSGVIVAQSAAQSLGLHDGSEVALRADTGTQAHTRVAHVTRNVIGSNVYITQKLYDELFGVRDSSNNAVYATLTGSRESQKRYVSNLEEDAQVMSAVSSAQQVEDFKFDLMGAVVALIVGLAGSLALVVLFTLAHTNVSERMREMATLKVLGFYDNEVHHYINKEMLDMTLMGIVLGLPLGRWIASMLTSALNMPSMYFELYISPFSYAIAALATLAFAFLVRVFVNPVLNRIDPVSSLKSVE